MKEMTESSCKLDVRWGWAREAAGAVARRTRGAGAVGSGGAFSVAASDCPAAVSRH